MSDLEKHEQNDSVPFNVTNLSEKAKESLLGILLADKVHNLENNMNQLATTMQISLSENKRDISQLREHVEKQSEKVSYGESAINNNYVTMTSLGAGHCPKIGPKMMGLLLRKVGIARPDYTYTVPKSEHTTGTNALVINKPKDGHICYYFHFTRCWKIITNRMKAAGILQDFENCKIPDEIHTFINKMEFIN